MHSVPTQSHILRLGTIRIQLDQSTKMRLLIYGEFTPSNSDMTIRSDWSSIACVILPSRGCNFPVRRERERLGSAVYLFEMKLVLIVFVWNQKESKEGRIYIQSVHRAFDRTSGKTVSSAKGLNINVGQGQFRSGSFEAHNGPFSWEEGVLRVWKRIIVVWGERSNFVQDYKQDYPISPGTVPNQRISDLLCSSETSAQKPFPSIGVGECNYSVF